MFALSFTFEFGTSKKHNPSPNSIRDSKKASPLAELNQRQNEARKIPFTHSPNCIRDNNKHDPSPNA